MQIARKDLKELVLIIKSANFIISAVSPKQWPEDGLPEIVFSGKSNVGKSSLINALANRKKLAYAGSTPGKTRMINFYDINGNLRFVDLPGYGYTKASKTEAGVYSKLAQEYFEKRENIRLVVQLIDIRHDPSKDDLQMIDFLISHEFPFVLAITKSDKLSRSQVHQRASKLANSMDISPDTPFVLTSSINTLGMEDIWDAIEFYAFGQDE